MLNAKENTLVKPKDDSLAMRGNPLTNGRPAIDKVNAYKWTTIEFLLTLAFESLTHNLYTRRAKVANRFGCTENTAAKWIDRALATKLIKIPSNRTIK